jgi:hypothetical protein
MWPAVLAAVSLAGCLSLSLMISNTTTTCSLKPLASVKNIDTYSLLPHLLTANPIQSNQSPDRSSQSIRALPQSSQQSKHSRTRYARSELATAARSPRLPAVHSQTLLLHTTPSTSPHTTHPPLPNYHLLAAALYFIAPPAPERISHSPSQHTH